MKFVGVDLHRQVISICVVVHEKGSRKVVRRRQFRCQNESGIAGFFEQLGPFEVVVEATSSYEWFLKLVEPMASRVVLAHPRKLRVIAESTRKTDKLDAQVLAEFLSLDMIPEAHRPTPRQREHRALVRHRYYLQGRVTSVKNKLRRILGHYNAGHGSIFSQAGRHAIREVAISASDRFIRDELLAELEFYEQQRAQVDAKLKAFARAAPIAEREARQALSSMPCVGPVTVDVVVSELGDVRRFRSLKRATAYAGLAPGIRESAGRTRQQGITKEGSRLLRWALVETAWRMVGKSRRWGQVYERLKKRCGAKKAIVAVARRLLGVMVALMRSGCQYRMATELT